MAMAVSMPGWNTAAATDPQLGVVSSGKAIPPGKAPLVSPSSRGQAGFATEVAPTDRLAEFKALTEFPQEMSWLLNLRPMAAAQEGAESIHRAGHARSGDANHYLTGAGDGADHLLPAAAVPAG